MADQSYSSEQSELDERDDVHASDAADSGSAQDQDNDQEQDDEELLKEAKARFELAQEAEKDIRRDALEDMEFRAGKQWPQNIQQDRERDGRPCLVTNRMPQFIQQITNDQRQNRPSIKVHPIDNQADIQTGKIIQGIIRHIEYNSNAEAAYDTAFEHAATGGYGYWRVVTDYASPTSFDQEIFIKRIRDQMSVSLDPHAQEPDASDANWGFVYDTMSRDEYERCYPDSKLSTEMDWESWEATAPNWVSRDSVRIAEYFYKTFKTVTICLLSNGDVIEKDKLAAYAQNVMAQAAQAGSGPPPITIQDERETTLPAVKWCKLNGCEVLEKKDWAGIYIPIIPIYGADLFIDGKRILEGVIRHAKDPQRMLNYWKSLQTETIALAPRSPWVGAEGQFEGHEEEWATANRRNHSTLEYKPTSINGQLAPPPQRQSFEPAVQGITQAVMMVTDDLKATTGIYDPSLGNQKADQSGIAIQRLNTQAQTSNFHFIDNMKRSLKHTGRILIDLIPRIYDTAKAIRIIGDDDSQKIVLINQGHVDESGKPVLYDLSAGRYDVTVDVGPSYASKRQEAAASMLSMAQSNPKIGEVAADLMVKNMDWPGADEIAERLKKTLPPGIADDPKNKQPLPPQAQAQMQQMGQMIDQLTKQLHASRDIIDMKKVEHDSRERIEMAKIQADIEIQMAKMGSQESIALLKHEIQTISERLSALGFNQPQQADLSAMNPSNPVQAPGAQGADVGGASGYPPTGGQSPGQPMEGN